MPELRPVPHRSVDIEHRRLAHEDVFAQGDRPCLDHTRVGAVAGQGCVLADDAAVADGQQVGTHRHGR